MSDQEHQPEADFVVAGAGTAACVIAARLSEYLDNVVLLEAGLIDGPEMMAIPSSVAALSGTTVDWAFRSEPQSALDGAVLEYPRGRVLGGSSSINAMAHIRARTGRATTTGCGPGPVAGVTTTCCPTFAAANARAARTAGGAASTGRCRSLCRQAGPFTLALRDAVLEAGIPFSDDLNGPRRGGRGMAGEEHRRRCSSVGRRRLCPTGTGGSPESHGDRGRPGPSASRLRGTLSWSRILDRPRGDSLGGSDRITAPSAAFRYRAGG